MNSHAHEKLAGILRLAVKDSLAGSKEAALMFSGGLDSAILAVMARKHCDLTLYTAGTEGSHDLEWGRECAATLDLPCVPVILDTHDIMDSMDRLVNVHGMRDPKWMTTFIGFDTVLGKISQERVLCGQGADELFGGYMKYRKSADPESHMAADLAELVGREFPMYRKVAEHYGRVLAAPFLDPGVMALAGALPMEQKIGDSGNKLALRGAAAFLGVPGCMAEKPKKAMQYGSGISGAVKRILRDGGIDLEGFMYRSASGKSG